MLVCQGDFLHNWKKNTDTENKKRPENILNHVINLIEENSYRKLIYIYIFYICGFYLSSFYHYASSDEIVPKNKMQHKVVSE